MGQITNVRVDYVSLVDKAAIRDVADPESPKTFLLKKRQTRKDTMTTTETTQADREAAAAEALEALRPLGDAVDPALLAKLAGLAGQDAPQKEEEADEEDGDEKLARAMSGLTAAERGVAVAKGEERERLRVAVHKAREAVELEYLHRVSPAAARKMEESRAR